MIQVQQNTLKAIDIHKLATLDVAGLKGIDGERLAAPFGEQYSTAAYGNQLDADGVCRAKDQVTKMVDATGAKSFAQALDKLPGEGESVHLVIGFRHSMGDLLPAVLKLSGQRIEECHIATLTFSRQNAADWRSMLDAGTVGKLAVIVSHYFSKTSPQIYDATVPTLRGRGAIVTPVRCHAKLLLCKLADGRTITAEGSANTRSAKTVEQVTIFSDPALYAFHRNWMDKLHTAADQAGERDTGPHRQPKRTAYSQKRASLGVWAARVSADDRANAIAWKSSSPPDASTTNIYAAAVVETIKQWSPVLPPGSVVTCPPQGASYPGHYFALDLAHAVAGMLNVPFQALLQRTDEKHYHHPRESMRQAPYRPTATPPGTVIVVDDLITSGTTMRLSIEALRAAGAAAFGFAFCGC